MYSSWQRLAVSCAFTAGIIALSTILAHAEQNVLSMIVLIPALSIGLAGWLQGLVTSYMEHYMEAGVQDFMAELNQQDFIDSTSKTL